MSNAHAILSPSGAPRWMRCAGSVALGLGLIDDSKYADEGTAAHELASWCLNDKRDAAAYINRVIKVEPSGREFTVDHEMAGYVQVYVDSVRQFAEGKDLFVEVLLPIEQITGEKEATGTGDAIILDFAAQEIQVHDLKYGKGVRVDAQDNEQLLIYALGALHLNGILGDFKRVRMVIHQPRLESLSEWAISVEELELFAFKVTAAAKVAMNAIAIRKVESARFETQYLAPGEKQCKFCKAKSNCPALGKFVEVEVGTAFTDLDRAPLVTASAGAEDLARKLAAVPLIEEWCRAISAHAEAELLAGNPVPGFKLVAGRRGNRRWMDEVQVETTLKSMRLKHDEMYEYSVISPATAEKRLKDQPRRWTRLEPLITQSDGKPSVAPACDRRPALEVKPVVDEFQNIEELA